MKWEIKKRRIFSLSDICLEVLLNNFLENVPKKYVKIIPKVLYNKLMGDFYTCGCGKKFFKYKYFVESKGCDYGKVPRSRDADKYLKMTHMFHCKAQIESNVADQRFYRLYGWNISTKPYFVNPFLQYETLGSIMIYSDSTEKAKEILNNLYWSQKKDRFLKK